VKRGAGWKPRSCLLTELATDHREALSSDAPGDLSPAYNNSIVPRRLTTFVLTTGCRGVAWFRVSLGLQWLATPDQLSVARRRLYDVRFKRVSIRTRPFSTWSPAQVHDANTVPSSGISVASNYACGVYRGKDRSVAQQVITSSTPDSCIVRASEWRQLRAFCGIKSLRRSRRKKDAFHCNVASPAAQKAPASIFFIFRISFPWQRKKKSSTSFDIPE